MQLQITHQSGCPISRLLLARCGWDVSGARKPRSESPKMPFPTPRWISRNRNKITSPKGDPQNCAPGDVGTYGTASQTAEKLMFCIRARLLVVPKMLEKRWAFSPCHTRRYERLDFAAGATPNHSPKRVGCIRRRKPRSDSPKMPFPTARWISRNRNKTEGGSAELCPRRCRYEGHGFQPCHMTLLN